MMTIKAVMMTIKVYSRGFRSVKLPKPLFFTKRRFRVGKEAAPRSGMVAASRCWRRCHGAARSASSTAAFESYLGAAPRVVERSVERHLDLAISRMRKLAHLGASLRFEVWECTGWASMSEEVADSGMRRSPSGSRHRGCHDYVMIYRGGSSVPCVRADVLGEAVVY